MTANLPDPAAILRGLLRRGEAFVALFAVTGDPEEVPPEVQRRFPGKTITLRFDFGGYRDAEVVERDGVERIEFWMPFYSTLGGERFFSLPTDRLLAIRVEPVAGVAVEEPKTPSPFKVIRGGKSA